MHLIGVDIGASAIKAGLVDVGSGDLVASLDPLPTDRDPDAVARQVGSAVERLGGRGPVGVAFPGILVGGVAERADNLAPSWRGRKLAQFLGERIDREVHVLNDADAAGLAEERFGGHPRSSKVVVLTFGTGIGSAVLVDGRLRPGTELGQLPVDGRTGEAVASMTAKRRERLTWSGWADRANRFLAVVEAAEEPDLLVLGGGISGTFDEWSHHLTVGTPVAAARFRNSSGVVGAAIHAHRSAAPQQEVARAAAAQRGAPASSAATPRTRRAAAAAVPSG